VLPLLNLVEEYKSRELYSKGRTISIQHLPSLESKPHQHFSDVIHYQSAA